ncbi:N-acetylmuramoyl-L-alanine amidase [Candidatus Pelagibacter sp.]|nr:N-acetylmuramoyl-L-alanine amidase [Candidatus Pelagibacter sp.]
MGLNLTKNYSLNFSLPKRPKKQIKFIIIHYTGMKSEKSAIKKLIEPGSKVSSHYFIKNSGQVINMVPDLYEAWHAGKSSWGKYNLLNKYSIGIEINNPGHQHGYKQFKLVQIASLKKLLKFLIKKYNIKNQYILGHSDIAPIRKKDPGEKFPWRELAKNRLCYWHNLNEKYIIKFRNQKISLNNENIFLKNLLKIGYSKKNIKFTIKAFQRRYRQALINGKIDKECFLISKNLLKY